MYKIFFNLIISCYFIGLLYDKTIWCIGVSSFLSLVTVLIVSPQIAQQNKRTMISVNPAYNDHTSMELATKLL